ncbi:MAG TPA: cytochrome C [Geobacterales bacterium]|nr:cytochrome C [Geobacterales bacterium]
MGRLLLGCAMVLLFASSLRGESGLAIDPASCLGCHGKRIPLRGFAASVHGKIACTGCHVELTDLKRHMVGGVKVAPVNCLRCHKKESAEYFASVHMLHEVTCYQCHRNIHTITAWKRDKRQVVALCSHCHDREQTYGDSAHGRGVAQGNSAAAACHDCHNLHQVAAVSGQSKKESKQFHTRVCLTCHADAAMMARNGVQTVAVETYFASYHGKNFRLGFPEKVAGCADCHFAHEVLPASNPRSSVNPARLVSTCGQCHRNSSPLFTQFYPHGEYRDRQHFPILFWTYVGMTALLVMVFNIFWLHSLLWLFRGFVENRQREAELQRDCTAHQVPHGHRQYRRFAARHIILHLMVITSFLGLSITGLPLKFNDQEWARFMMGLMGGSAHAGIIHRACAIITFIYFFAAIVMGVHFLLFRKDLKGNWLQRLFGPESLMPNLRDLRDFAAMVRWFLFKGEKPTFDRWSYWEKFDFLAVFWGMFAIGGSGLMLWFPEFFGQFLPGWMFNVATIIHSDEALLATGFIFTVHFFNTHGRPEKFPMDFVIFNGQISKAEFMEERGVQWERYEEEGGTEGLLVRKTSGVLYDFIFKLLGFLAVLIGLFLAALMLIAFWRGEGG